MWKQEVGRKCLFKGEIVTPLFFGVNNFVYDDSKGLERHCASGYERFLSEIKDKELETKERMLQICKNSKSPFTEDMVKALYDNGLRFDKVAGAKNDTK